MKLHTFSLLILSCLLLSAHSSDVSLDLQPRLFQQSALTRSVSPILNDNLELSSSLLAKRPVITNIAGAWNIININGKSVNVSATINHNTILFTYCDRMSYPYIKTGNKINIRSNWTTEVACCRMANGLFQNEVKETFVNSTSFSLIGNTLIFRDSTGQEKVRMIRQVAAGSDSCDLIDGDWAVLQVRGKNVNVNVTISDFTISYKYCNGKSMKYSASKGNSIVVTPGISTKMACIGLDPTEGEFDSAFTSAVRYEKQGINLRFYDKAGTLTAILRSRLSSTVPTIPTQPVTKSIAGIWTTSTVGDKSLSIVVNITKVSLLFTYCNSYSYPFSVSGNKISLGAPAATKMFCADMNPPESFVSGTFSSATSYKIVGNQLILYDASGRIVIRMNAGNNTGVIVNPPILTPVTQSIVGDWFTTSVKGSKVLVKVNISNSHIKYTYCNGKSLPYKSSGNTISVSSGISTMMYCSGLKPEEWEVDGAFMSAVTFKVSGNQLSLFDKSGNLLVTLQRQQVYKITPIFDKQIFTS